MTVLLWDTEKVSVSVLLLGLLMELRMDSASVVSTDSNLDLMSVILKGKCLVRYLGSLSDSLLDEQRVYSMAHQKKM